MKNLSVYKLSATVLAVSLVHPLVLAQADSFEPTLRPEIYEKVKPAAPSAKKPGAVPAKPVAKAAETKVSKKETPKAARPVASKSDDTEADKKSKAKKSAASKKSLYDFEHTINYRVTPTGPVTGTPAGKVQSGMASWYGTFFHGRQTANGERYNKWAMTAAHKTLAFGTKLRVVYHRTNRYVDVRINDRGPYIGARIIDLSQGAAQKIGMHGVGQVTLFRLK